MKLTPHVIDAMLAAGCTAEQIAAAVKAHLCEEEARGPRYIPPELRKEVFQRDNYTCVYCGARGVALHCDHVIPYSRGGHTAEDNLATACQACNLSKKDKPLDEWGGR